jgi:hypothetical protein
MNPNRLSYLNQTLRRGLHRASLPLMLGLALVAMPHRASAQLIFNFNAAAGTDISAIQGFQAAGARWSSLFNDSVTININIGFSALGAGILGQASSSRGTISYADARAALTLDAISADDFTAVANLKSGPNLSLLMNGTTEVGGNPGLTFVDTTGANTSTIRMTTANAKALGLLAGNNPIVDAAITFSNQFLWDFDPTDGITAGAFDFIGVATHEIGHAMGFISGVDVLDANMLGGSNPYVFGSDLFTYVSTLDLFRYSDESLASDSLDWTADQRSKFFSIDGGLTVGPAFSTGVYHGDGRQASHWKDNLGIGILDPTSSRGELLGISAYDIQAFDVIGWDRIAFATPEAGSTAGLLVLGFITLAGLRRRTAGSST